MPEALLFDAYGTLFDVYAIGAQLEAWYPGKGAAAAAMLRDKQIEYTRLITQSDPSPGGSRFYEPFWELTIKALRYTSKALDLGMDEARIAALMETYRRLPAFPEVAEVLGELKARGCAPGHPLQRRSRHAGERGRRGGAHATFRSPDLGRCRPAVQDRARRLSPWLRRPSACRRRASSSSPATPGMPSAQNGSAIAPSGSTAAACPSRRSARRQTTMAEICATC